MSKWEAVRNRTVGSYYNVYVADSVDTEVCQVTAPTEEIGKQRADLIAAAPEMLEALQNMTAMAHVYAGDDPKALALVAKATEIIFKAKGKL